MPKCSNTSTPKSSELYKIDEILWFPQGGENRKKEDECLFFLFTIFPGHITKLTGTDT